MFKIYYTQEAKDQIDKLNNKLKLRFKKAIERIACNLTLGKKLTHELTGLQSYRTGDYRILYRTHRKQIFILALAIGWVQERYL